MPPLTWRAAPDFCYSGWRALWRRCCWWTSHKPSKNRHSAWLRIDNSLGFSRRATILLIDHYKRNLGTHKRYLQYRCILLMEALALIWRRKGTLSSEATKPESLSKAVRTRALYFRCTWTNTRIRQETTAILHISIPPLWSWQLAQIIATLHWTRLNKPNNQTTGFFLTAPPLKRLSVSR